MASMLQQASTVTGNSANQTQNVRIHEMMAHEGETGIRSRYGSGDNSKQSQA